MLSIYRRWFALTLVTLALSATHSLYAEDISMETPPQTKVLGTIDVRPSWTTRNGTLGTENIAELGYQFSPNQMLTYVQEFYSNLYNPKVSGLNPVAGLGYVRTRFNRLYDTPDVGFHYELRAYLPTNQISRDAGMVSVLRNYLKFSRKFSDSFTFTAVEMPVLHFYTKPGFVSSSGPVANQLIENRIYLVADFNLAPKLSFSFPLMVHVSRYANYRPDAPQNNAWGFFTWIYPELTYNLSSNTSVGIAYYSDNLIKPDLSGMSVGTGLEKGVMQLVYTAFL